MQHKIFGWTAFLLLFANFRCNLANTCKSEHDLVAQFVDSLDIDWYWCLNPYPKDTSNAAYRKYYLHKIDNKKAFDLSLWVVKSFCRGKSDLILLADSNNNRVVQITILPPEKCLLQPEEVLLLDNKANNLYPDTAFENLSRLLIERKVNIGDLAKEDLSLLFTLYLGLRYETEYEEIAPFRIDNEEDLAELLDTLGVRDYEAIDQYKNMLDKDKNGLCRNDKIFYVYWGPGKTRIEIFYVCFKENSIDIKYCSYDLLAQ
ncbi:MAG: hypothetical protein U0U46_08520 [Saprospiraceae bacterium]